MQPKLFNIRLGFACNSSSTHSILILKPGDSVPEDEGVEDYEFGGDHWTASSKEAKGAWANFALRSSIGAPLADALVQAAGITPIDSPDGVDSPDGYVDHQSVPTMPASFERTLPHGGFILDWLKFLLRDDVVLLGGNDNHGYEHPLLGGTDSEETHYSEWSVGSLPGPLYLNSFPGGTDDGSWRPSFAVARQDDDLWTILNSSNGNRTTFSFNPDAVLPEKLKSPMLVDIKVTDYCPLTCPMCYQDSGPTGVHADPSYINGVLYNLGRVECFEVAFGGGEPTAHPQFAWFVDCCLENHVIPNLTTRSLKWAKANPKVVDKLSAIAISGESLRVLKPWEATIQKHPGVHWSVQLIDGLVPEKSIEAIHSWATSLGMRVTFLGWKAVGRGLSVVPQHMGTWLEWYKGKLVDIGMNEGNPYWFQRSVAIDTVIAKTYQMDFNALGVMPESYILNEGYWSCYIDGVKQQIGPSSFCSQDKMGPLKPFAFTQTFAKMPVGAL